MRYYSSRKKQGDFPFSSPLQDVEMCIKLHPNYHQLTLSLVSRGKYFFFSVRKKYKGELAYILYRQASQCCSTLLISLHYHRHHHLLLFFSIFSSSREIEIMEKDRKTSIPFHTATIIFNKEDPKSMSCFLMLFSLKKFFFLFLWFSSQDQVSILCYLSTEFDYCIL